MPVIIVWYHIFVLHTKTFFNIFPNGFVLKKQGNQPSLLAVRLSLVTSTWLLHIYWELSLRPVIWCDALFTVNRSLLRGVLVLWWPNL